MQVAARQAALQPCTAAPPADLGEERHGGSYVCQVPLRIRAQIRGHRQPQDAAPALLAVLPPPPTKEEASAGAVLEARAVIFHRCIHDRLQLGVADLRAGRQPVVCSERQAGVLRTNGQRIRWQQPSGAC